VQIHLSIRATNDLEASLIECTIPRAATYRQIATRLQEANPHLESPVALRLAHDISITLKTTPSSVDSLVIPTSNATVLYGLRRARELSRDDFTPSQTERTAPPMPDQEVLDTQKLSTVVSRLHEEHKKSQIPSMGMEVESSLGPNGGEVISLALSRLPPEADFPEGWTCALELDPPMGQNLMIEEDAVFSVPREDNSSGTVLQIGQGSLEPHEFSEAFGAPERLPSTWRHQLVNLPHPSETFSGVTVRLKVFNEHHEEVSSQTERIPAPAWTMTHHLSPIKEVIAIQKISLLSPPPRRGGGPTAPPKVVRDKDCERYLQDLQAAIPVPLHVLEATTNDAWARDIAFSGRALTIENGPTTQSELLQNPVERGTKGEAEVIEVLQKHCQSGKSRLSTMSAPQKLTSDLNSGGNFLCTPPLPNLPFGAIVTGQDSRRPVNSKIIEFIEAQGKQPLVRIDTSWLQVGHTDEVLTFVPWPGATHGFKALLADHSMALQLLDANSDASMFRGAEKGVESHYYRLGRALDRAGFKSSAVLAHAEVRQPEAELRDHLEGIKTTIINELGLGEEDIVRLPVLFRKRNPRLDDALSLPGGGREYLGYQPFTPNSVNMLVATQSTNHATLCIPKPFGPGSEEGTCVFEEAIVTALANSGNQIKFIDDYKANHISGGNIHCSTNELR